MSNFKSNNSGSDMPNPSEDNKISCKSKMYTLPEKCLHTKQRYTKANTNSTRPPLRRTVQEFCREKADRREQSSDIRRVSPAPSQSSLTRPLTLKSSHVRPSYRLSCSYDIQPKELSILNVNRTTRVMGQSFLTENDATDNFDTKVIEKFSIMGANYGKNLVDILRTSLSFDEVTSNLARSIGASLSLDDIQVFVIQLQPEELVFTLQSQGESVQRAPVKKESVPEIWGVAVSQRPLRDTTKNGYLLFYFPYISTVTKYRVVLKMTRRKPIFLEADERAATHIVIWGEATLSFMQSYEEQMKKQHLNKFILNVVEEIFQDVGAIDTIVRKIMHFAQKLVSADRSSLFIVDSNKQEMYATVFDERVDEIDIASGKPDPQQIRFPIGTGIAGHVAFTGSSLNIPDAYKDNRFNKDIDIKTGYRTRTMLCMPVFNRNTVIGVIQMVNKRNGELFTEGDMDSFKMMAVYCGLALYNSKLYNQIERSEKKYKVALDVLSYHNSCSEAEVTKALKEMTVFKAALVGFSINPFHFDDYSKVLCSIKMFTNIFDMTEFDYNTLVRFTFTVKKNYRKLPYHNWTHGFAVANSVYNIILNDNGILTKLEKLALYIGCLCHDLDHRGKSNKFMKETKSPLASIYSTSTMEHHHFNQAVMILQQDGHNIFENLSKSEYKELLGLLRSCILATDIEQFFKNKAGILDVMERKEFIFSNESHRLLALSIIMTAADLSACTKPWPIQAETVSGVNEEFYLQGDAERAAGRSPIPMMDRTRPEELPSGQVQFMTNICLPCYRTLMHLFPATKELYTGCQQNLDQWTRIRQDIRNVMDNNSMQMVDVANALVNMVFGTRGGGKMKKKLLRCFTACPAKP